VLKKHLYTILFISWVVFITFLSLFSFSELGDTSGIKIPHFDKIVHFIFHTVFVVLGCFFLKENKKELFFFKGKVLKMLFFAVLYGLIIEFLQYLMPFHRTAEILDVVANTSGAIFGSLLIKKYLSLNHKLK